MINSHMNDHMRDHKRDHSHIWEHMRDDLDFKGYNSCVLWYAAVDCSCISRTQPITGIISNATYCKPVGCNNYVYAYIRSSHCVLNSPLQLRVIRHKQINCIPKL